MAALHFSKLDAFFIPETFLITLGSLLILYAEIHYRFKFTPSFLYRRQPEIVADAPHRLEPGQPLPILLLIKDAHLFPIELQAIHVEVSRAHVPTRLSFQLQQTTETIASRFWWRMFPLKLPEDWCGEVELNVLVDYRCAGKSHRCQNDNYRGTIHAPLRVYLSEYALPSLPGYHHGDLHFHTEATSDQVEFGAPLAAAMTMAQVQGLSFFAATDHSYDLDDFFDDYLHNDPHLRKWHHLQEEIRRLNREQKHFVIVPGEEVSCGNYRGRNVHFLVLNHPEFIRGSGDSGEKWLRTRPEHSLTQILDVLSPQALAFAAHPAVPIPPLEQLLLRRDRWHAQDFQHRRLNGLQFWNGRALGEQEGLQHWQRLLLEGRKLFAIAGNDAHGNFNRFRQISFPFFKMAENDDHVFGRARTVVKIAGKLGLDSLMTSLRNGHCGITIGPLVDLAVRLDSGVTALTSETINSNNGRIVLQAISTPEFGKLERVTIWRGCLERKVEGIFQEWQRFSEPYRSHAEIPLPESDGNRYYLRARVISCSDLQTPTQERKFVALTNPIWILSKCMNLGV